MHLDISSDLLFKSFCCSGKVIIAIFTSKQRIHHFELLLQAGGDFLIFHDISGVSWFLPFRSHKYFDSAMLCAYFLLVNGNLCE